MMLGFKKLFQNTKTRALFIILGVMVILVVAFIIYRVSVGGNPTGGSASLGSVPGRNLENSFPNSQKLPKEYLQMLVKSDQQKASQALRQGGSAVPTWVKKGTVENGGNVTCGPCCQACKNCCQNGAGGVTSQDLLNQWTQSGDLSPAVAAQIGQLQDQNLSPDEYAQKIAGMVKTGKLTSDQAKQLMAAYRRQHAAQSSTISAKTAADDAVDSLLASGNISADTAKQLHDLNKQDLSPSNYQKQLDQLVKEGKITPDQAKQLMVAYRKQHAAEAQSTGLAKTAADDAVDSLLAGGNISSDAARQLHNLNKQNLSPSDYAAKLAQMVKAGKITPAQARQFVSAYRRQHTAQLSGSAKTAADDAVDSLLANGSVSSDTARQLHNLNKQNLSPSDYAAKLAQMVKAGKITPAQARQLVSAYRKQHAALSSATGTTAKLIEQLANKGELSSKARRELENLLNKKVPASDFASALLDLIRSKDIHPPRAAQQILSAYRDENGDTSISSGNPKLAAMGKQLQEEDLRRQESLLSQQQAAYKQAQNSQQQQMTQAKIQAMQTSMSSQAHALFTAWNATPQAYNYVALPEKQKGSGVSGATGTSGKGQSSSQNILIKAGDITFAVLETSVNSDQPGPVLAKIVAGKLKGAKLIGGVALTPDGERVMLQFNQMTMPSWPDVVSINAVAINPDTARTAVASSVNHHYLMRYGSLFAASFLQGYSQALQTSGSTVVNNAGTTTQTTPNLSPRARIMIGLGEIGNQLQTPVRNNLNRLPTVKVDAGVGLGVLFTSTVKQPNFGKQQ